MGAVHEEVVVLATAIARLGCRQLPFDMLVVVGGADCIRSRRASGIGGNRGAGVNEVDFGIRRPYSVVEVRAEDCVEL